MLEVLNQGFQQFLDRGDPRVKEWPMMQTPFPGFAMVVAYVYFVKVAGPQFMKKREPMELRTLMVYYNFLMVFVNLFAFLGLGWYGWFNEYSFVCQPVDYSNAHRAVRVVQIGYIFYLSKFAEFSDTIFFVLRKKYNQISALHVIHHAIVPFSLWFGIKYAPGGHHSFFAFMNSFVHVIMYSYYGLAALGEKYKKFLFWKKWMTYIQLAQFVVVIVHALSLYINKCDTSPTFITMNLAHAVLFFGLFLNFFFQTYTKNSSTRSKIEKYHLSAKKQPATGGDKLTNGTIANGHLKHRVPNEKKDDSQNHVYAVNSSSLKNGWVDGRPLGSLQMSDDSDEKCKTL